MDIGEFFSYLIYTLLVIAVTTIFVKLGSGYISLLNHSLLSDCSCKSFIDFLICFFGITPNVIHDLFVVLIIATIIVWYILLLQYLLKQIFQEEKYTKKEVSNEKQL